jgi:hypothetical protein
LAGAYKKRSKNDLAVEATTFRRHRELGAAHSLAPFAKQSSTLLASFLLRASAPPLKNFSYFFA